MVTTDPQRSISYIITADDYVNASRLRMRRYWMGETRVKKFVAVVIIACVMAFAISSFHSIAGSLASGAVLGLTCMISWFVAAYHFFMPWQARKIYGQQKTMHYPVEASWNNEAFSASSHIGENTVRWLDYHGWSADKTMILLMLSPVLFQMVPHHALSPEQADDLVDHIRRSGLRRI